MSFQFVPKNKNKLKSHELVNVVFDNRNIINHMILIRFILRNLVQSTFSTAVYAEGINISFKTWCLLKLFWNTIHIARKRRENRYILHLCNFMWPQHTLQMFTDRCGLRQNIPWETINRWLFPIHTILALHIHDQRFKFHTRFYETISTEFFVQGNFNHTQFSQEQWMELTGTQTPYLMHPKWALYPLS